MPKRLYFALFFLLAAVSCTQEAGKAEKKPQTAEELTRAIIQEVRQVIRLTDEQLAGRQPLSRELPPAEGRETSASLQLWMENGQPVRLTAITGRGQEANFYFANSELFFARQNDGQFIFISRELKYWLDEHWSPKEAPETDRVAREAALLGEAERYLGAF